MTNGPDMTKQPLKTEHSRYTKKNNGFTHITDFEKENYSDLLYFRLYNHMIMYTTIFSQVVYLYNGRSIYTLGSSVTTAGTSPRSRSRFIWLNR